MLDTFLHDRMLIAKNGINILSVWTTKGLCRYVDDKRISDWQLAAGVQFPFAVLRSDKCTILTETNFVKDMKYADAAAAISAVHPALTASDGGQIRPRFGTVTSISQKLEKSSKLIKTKKNTALSKRNKTQGAIIMSDEGDGKKRRGFFPYL